MSTRSPGPGFEEERQRHFAEEREVEILRVPGPGQQRSLGVRGGGEGR